MFRGDAGRMLGSMRRRLMVLTTAPVLACACATAGVGDGSAHPPTGTTVVSVVVRADGRSGSGHPVAEPR